jgi:Ca2+-binding RTX toxin-like protein
LGNRLIGNAGANQLVGAGGNDYLNGGAGADTMIGGTGNDSYEVADTGDTVIENANEGIDTVTLYTVWIGTTYALNPNVEKVILSEYVAPGSNSMYLLGGVRGANITGSAVDNTFTGNSADDSFYGGGGNDVLIGMWGNDTLDGGTGADTMNGGAGNDVFYVDDAGDVVIDDKADAGIDTVYSSVGFTLQDGVERLILTGAAAIDGVGNAANNMLTGNDGGNLLTGGAGDDILDGGLGADTLDGGTGNDTYIVDASDVIIESADSGVDTVISYGSFTLADNLENLSLAGTAAINATGNYSANRLTGNGAANYLFGGGGDDTLDGGMGNDTAAGGAGDDLYYVESIGDVVIENAGEGTDTVMSSVSFSLGENIENLSLTGSAAINATGNSLANILYGNIGANILDGGAGDDTLMGGLGDDTYIVSDSGDTIVELAGEGNDMVRSTASYVLGAWLENLTLDGNLAIDGTGNSASNNLLGNSARNVLTGYEGDDTLDGGGGDDLLVGGAGNDSYFVDSAADVIVENAGEGLDQVTASVSYMLQPEVEVLVLAGTAANGAGNAANNLIKGNASANALAGNGGNDILQGGGGDDVLTDSDGNNILDGGAGADTLSAGAGNDFLAGGAGDDIITTGTGRDIIAFNRGDGMDVVNASTTMDNTISLGKGIRYSDLLFKKNLNDLILVTGTNEQITLKDWYAATPNHSVANLQIVIEGTADYIATSTNVINNRKIELFNFDGLVAAFDQARAKKPNLTSWALSGSLSTYYLSGSDTAALGGDLAYQYARNGSLASLSMTPAQTLLADPAFGQGAQVLQPPAGLLDTSPRLM